VLAVGCLGTLQRAGGGQANPEIASQLCLSPAPWNGICARYFGKLGVGSRRELRAALSDAGAAAVRP